jgi:hypothetical protein
VITVVLLWRVWWAVHLRERYKRERGFLEVLKADRKSK